MGQFEPDSDFEPHGFAEAWWSGLRRVYAFEDHVISSGDEGFDFGKATTDPYDSSVEFKEVPPDCRLNRQQQQLLWASGFKRCWLCHTDGRETYYPSFGTEKIFEEYRQLDAAQPRNAADKA